MHQAVLRAGCKLALAASAHACGSSCIPHPPAVTWLADVAMQLPVSPWLRHMPLPPANPGLHLQHTVQRCCMVTVSDNTCMVAQDSEQLDLCAGAGWGVGPFG